MDILELRIMFERFVKQIVVQISTGRFSRRLHRPPLPDRPRTPQHLCFVAVAVAKRVCSVPHTEKKRKYSDVGAEKKTKALLTVSVS